MRNTMAGLSRRKWPKLVPTVLQNNGPRLAPIVWENNGPACARTFRARNPAAQCQFRRKVIFCRMLWLFRTENEHMSFRADIKSAASLLPICRISRAVLCISACRPEAYKINKETDRLQHSFYLSHGCPFYCLGREKGHPPRVA
jgi:hypothetical protein